MEAKSPWSLVLLLSAVVVLVVVGERNWALWSKVAPVWMWYVVCGESMSGGSGVAVARGSDTIAAELTSSP